MNVYAAVPHIESEMWSNIATVAIELDKDDFLYTRYPVDEAKFPVLLVS